MDGLAEGLSAEQLIELGAARHKGFLSADPFPHAIFENLVNQRALEAVLEEFPETPAGGWLSYDRPEERKRALQDESQLGPVTRDVISTLNGQRFIAFLEALSGIKGLVPDPTLAGGGLHLIRSGGFLKVHADFQIHTYLLLQRRLNVIVYLNKDWSPSYGGSLELWDAGMTRAVATVRPEFGRVVVFQTSADSFHGHPEPLTCPPERARRSLALYYYSLPEERADYLLEGTTDFRLRPGESLRPSLKQRIKPWVPPALLEMRDRRRRLG